MFSLDSGRTDSVQHPPTQSQGRHYGCCDSLSRWTLPHPVESVSLVDEERDATGRLRATPADTVTGSALRVLRFAVAV